MTDCAHTARMRSLDCEQMFRSYRPLTIAYAPGEMICQAGSYIAGIHLIVEGVVADTMIRVSEESRNTQILAPGDWIGVEILDNFVSRVATSLCRAVTRVELLFVERQQLLAAIEDHSCLRQFLVSYLVSRLIVEREDLRDKASLEGRMARLLLQLGQACGRPAGDGVTALPSEITPRLIGDLLCITSRQMRQVRQCIDGLRSGGRTIAFDVRAVRRMVEHDCNDVRGD